VSAEQIAVEPDTDDVDETTDRPRLFLVPVPGPLASLASDLRPYLPTRSQLAVPFRGVGAGSGVLLGRAWTWMGQDGWIWEGWTKAGAVAAGTYFGLPVTWDVVVGITGPYAPFAPTVAVVCACVTAKWHSPDAQKAREKKAKTKAKKASVNKEAPDGAADQGTETAVAQDQEHDEPEQVGGHAPEDVVQLVREVAARNQHSGAHLEDLLAEPLFEGWEKADLKAELTDRLGIHVESFKLFFDGRQRNRDGVRLRHLPEAPADPVGEGAGEWSAQGLSLVPDQPSAGRPSSTLPAAPAGPRSGARAEAAETPSPTRS
jgi:hypothetical protein